MLGCVVVDHFESILPGAEREGREGGKEGGEGKTFARLEENLLVWSTCFTSTACH